MFVTLRAGSKGEFVEELQRILRVKATGAGTLKMDGKFGPATRNAVLSFQAAEWLSEDAIVGHCTWVALKDLEIQNVLHPVKLMSQHTEFSCWSAATAMTKGVTNKSLGRVGALLGSKGDLGSSWANVNTFANGWGLKVAHKTTWRPDEIYQYLKKGPVMNIMGWNSGGAHAVTIAGLRGDGSAEGTTLRIYDPWPVLQGSVYSLSYGPFLRKIPRGAFYLFYT